MAAWQHFAELDEMPADGTLSKGAVTVVAVDGRFSAIASRCPHMGYPMAKGTVRDGVITCAWHDWEFDLSHGGCYRGACDDLPVYPIELRDGAIWVDASVGAADAAAERRLREALMEGDLHLQAKALAQLLAGGASTGAVLTLGLAHAHAHAHAVAAHRSYQAVRETRALLDACDLASHLSPSRRAAALLQGLRASSGPVGSRPALTALPGEHQAEALLSQLARCVSESSALGVERCWLTLNYAGVEAGVEEQRMAQALLEAACAPALWDQRQLIHAAVTALQVSALDHDQSPAWCAALVGWSLGAERREPAPDARRAIAWSQQRAQRLAAAQCANGAEMVPAEELQAAIARNDLEYLLDTVLGWVEDGFGFDSLLDTFSLHFARRAAAVPVPSSGLWGSAGAGLQVLRQLRWAGARWSGHWRCHGLLALALDAFQTRWLPAPKAWSGAAATTFDGSAYVDAMAAGDHRRARALLPAAALSPDDLSHYLSAALAEDLSIDQLDFLNTAVSEAATQAEWQPYLAAASALIIDQRTRRDIADATRFARGMLG